MNPLLALLVVALLGTAVACGQVTGGDTGAGAGTEPEPSGSAERGPSGSAEPTGAPEVLQVVIVSGSDAGGSTSTEPTVLDGQRAVEEFVGALGRDLPDKVREAVAGIEVPEDSRLLAAVVSIGCDVPTSARLTERGGEPAVVPVVRKSGRQCLVPITSVALLVVR